MNIKEEYLEEMIFENSKTLEGREKLYLRGLSVDGKMYRQVSLGNYGRLDLVTVYIEKNKKEGNAIGVTIYELKQDRINIETLLQACRYLTAIVDIYKEKYNFPRQGFKIRLIGNNVDFNSDFLFLYNCLSDVEIYLYDYNIDGLSFKKLNKDFFLRDKGYDTRRFNITKSDIKEMFQPPLTC